MLLIFPGITGYNIICSGSGGSNLLCHGLPLGLIPDAFLGQPANLTFSKQPQTELNSNFIVHTLPY